MATRKKKVARTKTSTRKKTAKGKKVSMDAALSGMKKTWNSIKGQQPTGGRGGFGPNENVPQGTYLAQVVGASTGMSKNGNPYFSLKYVLHGGKDSGDDYAGEQINDTDWLEDRPLNDDGLTSLGIFKDRMWDLGWNGDSYELSESGLKSLAAEVNEYKPFCEIAVVNKHSTNQKGEPVLYQNVYVNRAIEPDDFDGELEEMVAG